MSQELKSAAERLYALFKGNQRSVGRFKPPEKMWTDERPPAIEDFAEHLEGKAGVGVVPVMDDDTCVFAALDLDNHDSDEDLPIMKIAAEVEAKKLPLIPCRSKSGGVHLYAFFKKPMPAARVRTVMAKWAGVLGQSGCEIFPKQAKLFAPSGKTRQLGNWINLPYFNTKKTIRFAVHDGKRLSLEDFLALADRLGVTDADIKAQAALDHPDAPPCVQRMYSEGVGQGHRNEALYNVVIYLKKAFPDSYEALSQEANATIFSKPLSKSEATRTVASAARPDYKYRCHEEPCRSLCDRDTCFKRKFGISKDEYDNLSALEAIPGFSDLVKYLSDPVRWELKIDGVPVRNLGTHELLDWKRMRELIAERLTKVVPMIKSQEWERMLQPMMREARIVEAPDDASVSGVVRARLREFAAKTDLAVNGAARSEDRAPLLRGLPVVIKVDGIRSVAFRGQDFVNYLKRTKSEELKGINLWFAVKDLGVRHTKIRAGSRNVNVWCMPVKEVLQEGPDEIQTEFKSEL